MGTGQDADTDCICNAGFVEAQMEVHAIHVHLVFTVRVAISKFLVVYIRLLFQKHLHSHSVVVFQDITPSLTKANV